MTGAIMYISGGRWDGIPGTDRLLAEALAEASPVLWVDQPVSIARYADVRRSTLASIRGRTEMVQPGLRRLRLPALPGFSRPFIRRSTEAISRCSLRALAGDHNGRIKGVINASPLVVFPREVHAPRVLHVTDDWLGSAPLLGLAPRHVERVLRENLALADTVTAVSPGLAHKIQAFSGRQVNLLPNGCRTPKALQHGKTMPVAALVGQLNERLDARILELLGESGLPLVVLGPRTEKEVATRRALDRFLSRPTIQWRGPVGPDEVSHLLSTARVGLTPYAESEFNVSSFPLKTLEYLSFGLPVVATDLPAARWLGNPYVCITGSPTEFVNGVRDALQIPSAHQQRLRIQSTARSHTWCVRAEQMLALIEGRQTTEPGTSSGPHQVGSR